MEKNLNWCNSCGHSWFSRKEKRSRQCPDCLVSNWDREGTRLQFNFSSLEIGGSAFYPWYEKNGKPDYVKNPKINRALTTYEHRSGRKFKRESGPRGLCVTRVS